MLSDDPLVDRLTTIFTASGVGTPEEWEQAMQVPEMKAQLEPLLESFVKDDQLLIPVTLQANGTSDEAQQWAAGLVGADEMESA